MNQSNLSARDPVQPRLGFDEQLWPIAIAFVLLCGCEVGWILAVCDFQTGELWRNGYVLLGGFVVFTTLICVTAIKLGVLRGRRLLLAALLSITLHLGVGMVAYKAQRSLFAPGPKNDVAVEKKLRDIDVLRDYQFTPSSPDRKREAHERPVDTIVTENRVPDLARLAPEQGNKAPAIKPDNMPAAEPKAPDLVAMIPDRKPIEAAPRRGDLDAKLTRQSSPIKNLPAAGPIAAPNQTTPTTVAGPIEAKSIPLGRQTFDPKVPRRADEVAIATMSPGLLQPGGPRSAPAPRADDHPSPSLTAGPALVKTILEPRAISRGDAPAAAAPAKIAIPDLSSLQPATGVGRQSAPGAIVGRAPSSTETPDAALMASAAPIRPAMNRPTSGGPATDTAAPRLTTGAPKRPAAPVADIAAAAVQNERSSTAGPLAPTPTAVTRGTTAAGAPSRPAAPDLTASAGAGGFGVTVAMAGPHPGKPQMSAGPSVDMKLPANGPAGLGAAGISGAGKSPIAAPVAGLPIAGPPGGIAGTPGSSASADSPAAGPARVGISKASGGPVGAGHGEGMDVGVAAAAPQPSVAMNLGSGGGLARRAGDGAGSSGGPAVGIGQPGGLARDASTSPATSGAVAFNPMSGNRVAGGGAAPGGGSLDTAATTGLRQSKISGPLGGGAGLGGSGTADVGANLPSLSVGIGGGTGGSAGNRRDNEQASIGLGIAGQQLPKSIGGAGGSGGVAAVVGGDLSSASAMSNGHGAGGAGGLGGSGEGPGGPIDSRATGAARTAPGAGIPAGAAVAGGTGGGDGPGGDGGNGGGGQIGAAQIGRPGAGRDGLPGGITGGVAGGLGSGIGRPGSATAGGLSGDVKAESPQLAAGTPTGSAIQGTGLGGVGPGGDGSGQQGPNVNIARQATGGLPSGAGSGSGGGNGDASGGDQGAGGVAMAIAGVGVGQIGRSGNGEGGPDINGTGLGAKLPRGPAGLSSGSDPQSDAPQFAGSPSDAGIGVGRLSPAGGAGGNGPGGPGGEGPGGDGSGRRFGSSGLPTPAPLAGGADGPITTSLPQFGLPNRRALADSDNLQISSGRFLQKQAGGGGGPNVAADAPARAPAPSFVGRGLKGRGKNGAGDVAGSDGRTEATIELGLAYLAQMQNDDGSWSLHRFPGATEADIGNFHSDTAATGLALLAFLGAGYDHFDDKYHDTVRGGLEYLLRHQLANGDLYVPMDAQSNQFSRLYSHAIASIALCEALGMTGDQKLKHGAQKAVDFIIASQNKELGGWRYKPGQDSDVSVTGWQTTALKSGELAGLNVPKEAYAKVSRFLDYAQASKQDGSRYVYRPQDPNSQRPEDARRPTMTAVALLQRIYLGWRRDNPALLRGADYIRANLPKTSDVYARDTYYWYYATQVMFQLKGDYWQAWSDRLNPLLINSQTPNGPLAGSWDPGGRIPDRWGAVGGRIYVTTMNLLSLEVYFRHLPIYETPGEGK